MIDQAEFTDLTRLIAVSQVTSDPVEMIVDASKSECKKLSESLEILEIIRLHVRLKLVSPDDGVTVHLSGLIEADLVQSCVVSLDPVASQIEAALERIYSAQEKPDDGEDITIELDADEPFEPLSGYTINVGQAIVEQLALEIDPFPRAPGVEFSGLLGVDSGDNEEPSGQFAALSKLKRNAD
jgi:uncharacterized metal-binding protein YceD (DUF177 family)